MVKRVRNNYFSIRSKFGENWQRFLGSVDDAAIRASESALSSSLGRSTLTGVTFLDIGSGSGLSSLAAARLGARVHSFDFDPRSVACTRAMKQRFRADDTGWTIESGSILDPSYVRRLGTFDIVHAWGVLHHTGRMWDAIENAISLVKPGGTLFIAIYNDQAQVTRYWTWVKRLYNARPSTRPLLIAAHAPYLVGLRQALRWARAGGQPGRGMNLWDDMIDWLGGFPFEVAKPEEILRFCRARGLSLENLKTCGGRLGCNEFVFQLAGARETSRENVSPGR